MANQTIGGVLYAFVTKVVGGGNAEVARNEIGFGANTSYTPAVSGAGNVDAGTQRVTLGADDPAVVALQAIAETSESTDPLAVVEPTTGNRIGTRALLAPLTRVAYTSSSAQSASITTSTEVTLINCGTARCFIATGANPTATTNSHPLPPDVPYTIRIAANDKIAVIRDTADGFLNIVPVA
jgi:hypothetical protein